MAKKPPATKPKTTKAPDWLNDEAKAEFDRLIILRNFADTEIDRLAEYASTCADSKELRKTLDEEGLVIYTKNEVPYTHPAHNQLSQINKRKDSLGKLLFPPPKAPAANSGGNLRKTL